MQHQDKNPGGKNFCYRIKQPLKMKKIILTILVTFGVLFIGFFFYMKSGAYDISQLTPHNGFTKWIIRETTSSSIDKRMKENPVPANLEDTSVIIAGFRHYNEMCVMCHGAPGVKE